MHRSTGTGDRKAPLGLGAQHVVSPHSANAGRARRARRAYRLCIASLTAGAASQLTLRSATALALSNGAALPAAIHIHPTIAVGKRPYSLPDCTSA